eukprot:TRINITY_DN8716_c0_g1_i1.p1 TRINITY_DN8716_c0_g1~~TRINITY_DN8716_c0_g1_i1.p1  ORF type:complete len:598 (+),score=114.19 TRINITY_DN8716_c0_g1_i1:242-2035(+)
MARGASSSSSAAALAPGFRFHPTDEELVSYYLRRKLYNKPFRFEAISVVDIYKFEPWDLPDLSLLKSRDLEWYFFCILDKKYGNGRKTNRATEQGYWKTTGKDRAIQWNSRAVGMKKTLVFHIGRAPKGERTNWVMHEYRMVDEELGKEGIAQDAFVLCRIFQKSGPGPKNGEMYGAPFIEEEWDEDVLVPKKESSDDNEQNTYTDIPYENVFLPSLFDGRDHCNHLENPSDFLEGTYDDQKFLGSMGENSDFPEIQDAKFFGCMGENIELPEIQDDQKFLNDVVVNTELQDFDKMPLLANDKLYMELNDLVNADYLSGETVDHPSGETVDGELINSGVPNNNPPIEDGSFLEMDDILNCEKPDASGFEMLDEYLSYFDATDDNLDHTALDSSVELLEGLNPILHQTNLSQEVDGGTVQAYLSSQQASKAYGAEEASSSKQKLDARGELRDKSIDVAVAPDFHYEEGWGNSIAKSVSRMLGSIPASPAFAAEHPMKGGKSVAENSAAHSSSSIHVTAGMIHISSVNVAGSSKHLSHKDGGTGFVVSYAMTGSLGSVLLENLPASAMSVLLRSGFYLFLLCVPILAISFKMGSCIYTR